MRKLAIAALTTLTAVEIWALPGVLRTESETLKGDIKWRSRTKQYVVSVKKGTTMVDLERGLADVVSLDIPKPAGYDRAVQQVEAGQGAMAIAVLQKIVADYRMLSWDKPAGRYLAMAYLASGQPKKAYDVCEEIIAEDRSAAWTGDLAAAYWQSLLKLGRTEKLEGLLNRAASSGTRQASAAALVMRGDIIVSSANGAHDKLKEALRDGYLRVAFMYNDPECARERAEAMLKAAKCLEALGQTARAEKLKADAKML